MLIGLGIVEERKMRQKSRAEVTCAEVTAEKEIKTEERQRRIGKKTKKEKKEIGRWKGRLI